MDKFSKKNLRFKQCGKVLPTESVKIGRNIQARKLLEPLSQELGRQFFCGPIPQEIPLEGYLRENAVL